jgi:hypothetical protein
MKNDSNPMKKTNSKEKLILTFNLFKKSWDFYRRRFLDFIEMYLWGLLGAVPLLVIALIFLGVSALGFEQMLLRIVFIVLLLLALLWSLYYGIRAHIGIILLIKNTEAKVKATFLETDNFFRDYVVVSLVSGFFLVLLTLLLIVPGVIFYVYWSFATMLVVVEGIKSTMPALKRSKSLVKGYWWAVAGRLLFIGVLYSLLIAIIMIPADTNIDPVTKIETFKYLSQEAGQFYVVFVNIISAILSPLLAAYTYFLYKDLSAKKK